MEDQLSEMFQETFQEMFNTHLRAYTERERAWWKQDRRGRWVVFEPGPGRLLKNSPQHIRDYVNAITPQRARRFRSLSRARGFAREIGGVVRRWSRHMPRRVMGRKVKTVWRLETNPWKRVSHDQSRWICCMLDKDAA